MSAWTVIRLDTTPPEITWGPVTNAIASETMTVLYLVDEPEVIEATLVLTDNRALQCLISSDRITVDIPANAPEGPAVLTAKLRDDVGNEALATLDIHVTGVIVPGPPPVPVLPGLPEIETKRTRCTALTRSRYRLAVRTRLASQATIRSRTRIARRPALSSPSGVSVRSSGRVRAHATASSRLQFTDRWTITKRPEGPETEAAVVALLL